MRASLLILACLPATLSAQSSEFSLFPRAAERVAVRTSLQVPNTLLTQVDGSAIRGACQTQTPGGVLGRMRGFRFEVQDENGTTAPQLAFVIRQAATSADIFSVSFNLPPGEPSVDAYTISAALSTPFDGLPLDQTFHFGVRVPAALGANDYISILGNPRSAAEPKSNAPRVTFSVEPSVGLVPLEESLAISLLTDGVTMMVGAVTNAAGDRIFGRPGLYPDRSAGYGLAFRVDGGPSRANRPFFVLGGAPFGFSNPTAIPGFDGRLLMITPLLPDIAGVGTLNAAGKAEIPSPLVGYGFATYTGQLYFQALIAGGTPTFSTGCRTDDL
ncbi:MAG: hypothetical protein O2865_14555 [Planctomycetota bacterium]|nr:hypothetical protein [Planctomycetota bacterium]MDA0934506.1 hypothetical protein [Planctomycetota bacterium]MDA1223198.1 hypothetical protein [Planctomycetota bacterium]